MAKVNNKTKGFNSISRELVFDNVLSDRARFVYVYMACKPDGWDFFQDKVAKELGYKKDTLRKYLDELIMRGWIVEEEQENEKGKFGALKYTIENERKGGVNLPIRKKTDTEKTRYGKNHNQKDIDNNSSTINSPTIKDIEEKRLSNDNQKKGDSSSRFVKPTIEQIEAYIKEKDYHFDAEHFWNYYESIGWMVGTHKMKDWKAACSTWERKRKSNNLIRSEEQQKSEDEDRKLWEKQKEWLKKKLPNIAPEITQGVMKEFTNLAICDKHLLQETLEELNKVYDGGDIVERFREILNR